MRVPARLGRDAAALPPAVARAPRRAEGNAGRSTRATRTRCGAAAAGTGSTPATAPRSTARARRASPPTSADPRGRRASRRGRRAPGTSAAWARRRRPGVLVRSSRRPERAGARSSRPRPGGHGCGAASGSRRPRRTGPGRRVPRADTAGTGRPRRSGVDREHVVAEPRHRVGERAVAAADLEHPCGRGGQMRPATNGSRFMPWGGAASRSTLYRPSSEHSRSHDRRHPWT